MLQKHRSDLVFKTCLFLFICMRIRVACIYVDKWFACCQGRPEELSHLWKLKLKPVVSYWADAGNQTSPLCKSSQCTKPKSSLLSPVRSLKNIFIYLSVHLFIYLFIYICWLCTYEYTYLCLCVEILPPYELWVPTTESVMAANTLSSELSHWPSIIF